MAKILGKDTATYAKEREGFLRDLQHFHETRGYVTQIQNPSSLTHTHTHLVLLQNPLQEGAQGERTGNRPLPAVYPRNATGRMVEGKNVTFTPTFFFCVCVFNVDDLGTTRYSMHCIRVVIR